MRSQTLISYYAAPGIVDIRKRGNEKTATKVRDTVISIVAEVMQAPESLITKTSRKTDIVLARGVLAYVMKTRFDIKNQDIAKVLGLTHRSTINYYLGLINNLLETDKKVKEKLIQINLLLCQEGL